MCVSPALIVTGNLYIMVLLAGRCGGCSSREPFLCAGHSAEVECGVLTELVRQMSKQTAGIKCAEKYNRNIQLHQA